MTPDNSEQLRTQLARALADLGHIPLTAQWCRLRGGRTNWAWRVDRPEGRCVVKFFSEADTNLLFPNDPASETLMLHHLAGTRLAPDLIRMVETAQGTAVLYTYLEGAPWRSDSVAVAGVLHRLHRQAVPDGLRAAPDGSAALTAQTHAILDQWDTPKAWDLAAMGPEGDVPPAGSRRLLHGDPVPGNLIEAAVGLRLIDWQCPAVGDPCADIAIFLSPEMQHTYRGTPLSAAETRGFLEAYPDRQTVRRYLDLVPWYHWRMAAYCLWKSEQGHTSDQGVSLAESVQMA